MVYRRARAFTLIELLVVVAIIAVLIALLIPGLSRAKKRAVETKCAANLKSWAFAINFYAQDNNNYVCGPVIDFPPFIGGIVNSNGTWLTADKLAPFMVGFTPNQPAPQQDPGTFSKAWVCPALAASADIVTMDPGGMPADFFGWNWFWYSYYGHVSQWSPGKTLSNPEDFTDTTLNDANKLLMSDTIVYGVNGTPNIWFYNHGNSRDHAVVDVDSNGGNSVSTASMTTDFRGMNDLYGDSHVEWTIPNVGKMAQVAAGTLTTYPNISNNGGTYLFYR